MSEVLAELPLPPDLTALEAQERALTYRLLARKMASVERRNALLRLAERFEKLAREKGGEAA